MPHTALLLAMTDTVPLDMPNISQSLGLVRMSRLDSHTLYASLLYCTADLVGICYIAWRQGRSYSVPERIPNMFCLTLRLQRCYMFPWGIERMRFVLAKPHMCLLHMTRNYLCFHISRQRKADKANESL